MVSMASGIMAGLAAAGAVWAEPSGWFAVGVWLGLADEPLVISVAPWLGMVATVCGTISGLAFFWAKWQSRSPVKPYQDSAGDKSEAD